MKNILFKVLSVTFLLLVAGLCLVNYHHSVKYQVFTEIEGATSEDRIAFSLFLPQKKVFEFGNNVTLEVTYSPGLVPKTKSVLRQEVAGEQKTLHTTNRAQVILQPMTYYICGLNGQVTVELDLKAAKNTCSRT